MDSLILKTVAKIVLIWMFLFSFWVLFRGHNAPGGGFVGGLIASSSFSLYLIAYNASKLHKILRLHLMSWLFIGGFILLIAGMIQILPLYELAPGLQGVYYLTSHVYLLFDIGVYMVVCFSVLSILVGLERIN